MAPAGGERTASPRRRAGAGPGVRNGRPLSRVATQRVSRGRVRLLARHAHGRDDVGPSRGGRRVAPAAPRRGCGWRDVRLRAPKRRGSGCVLRRAGSGGPNRRSYRAARRERARQPRHARRPRPVLPPRGAADRGLLSDGPAYAYLPRSMAYLPAPAEMLTMLGDAGFTDAERRQLSGGITQLLVGTRA